MQKVRLAIVSSYGLDKGGTEKFLQTVAANLPKNKYEVDYYFIDSDPERISVTKKNYLTNNNVDLISYTVEKIVTTKRYIKQIRSNFFNVYRNNYDIILTGSCGYPEEPMTKIKNVPIIQSIHYVSGVDNQYNISRVLHISEFSKRMWVKKGGDIKRVEMISHPIQIPEYNKVNLRKYFEIDEETIVFGFHQRNDNYIFSDIPLNAYKKVESEKTAFLICGGSTKYREQAKNLKLKHCFFLPFTDQDDIIYSFLETINIYAHGRYDGELNSTALAEAMAFGLPIITHPSSLFNGHLEIIRENGYVAYNVNEYASYLKYVMEQPGVLEKCSKASKQIFQEKYSLNGQMRNLIRIFDEVLKNPYPNPIRRWYRGIENSVLNMIKKYM